ncbi:nucleotidyltransferase family protein [Metapseudomonas otitidis]|nr:nucleotidyltransferase family protein [Pseudomonas otitidis]
MASLGLKDAWLAAGFVRNLAWDQLHGYRHPTPLNDIDLIHFDPDQPDAEADARIEAHLRQQAGHLRWSVKNQARMHLRNGDAPYRDSCDAMARWPEVETAIGVRLRSGGGIEIATPFVQTGLLALRLTPNLQHRHPHTFAERVQAKGWLRQWPRLQVEDLPRAGAWHADPRNGNPSP